MNIISSALGNYKPIGNPNEADVIIGHSFGLLTDGGSVNQKLASYITNIAGNRPIIADKNLADSFTSPANIVHVVKGPVSDSTGNGVGTWGTLLEAKAYMNENELELALMVGQAHHIGRIAMQATHPAINLNFVVPDGLPNDFETTLTKQWWTRSASLWLPREVIGSIALKRQGKL